MKIRVGRVAAKNTWSLASEVRKALRFLDGSDRDAQVGLGFLTSAGISAWARSGRMSRWMPLAIGQPAHVQAVHGPVEEQEHRPFEAGLDVPPEFGLVAVHDALGRAQGEERAGHGLAVAAQGQHELRCRPGSRGSSSLDEGRLVHGLLQGRVRHARQVRQGRDHHDRDVGRGGRAASIST